MNCVAIYDIDPRKRRVAFDDDTVSGLRFTIIKCVSFVPDFVANKPITLIFKLDRVIKIRGVFSNCHGDILND